MEYYVHIDGKFHRKMAKTIVQARKIAIEDLVMKKSNLMNRPIYTSPYGKGLAGTVSIENGHFVYAAYKKGMKYYKLKLNGEIMR